jgi:PhoPQ-activated pathogenicity-related protein
MYFSPQDFPGYHLKLDPHHILLYLLLILYLLSCDQPSAYALGYILIFLVWSLSTYSLQKKVVIALHHVQWLTHSLTHSLTHTHTHTHTHIYTHLVGLLWTSDRSVTEAPTWHHTDIHAPDGIRTRSPSKRTAAETHALDGAAAGID